MPLKGRQFDQQRRVTCPTTCFPLMKASNPQTAAHSPSGKTYLASMGTVLWLVYFWKMMTFEGETSKRKEKKTPQQQHRENGEAKTLSFFSHLREQVHQFTLHMDGLKGELLAGAVQKPCCDILQRVRNHLHAVCLLTDHCACKNHP